jgi:hypothetical protein
LKYPGYPKNLPTTNGEPDPNHFIRENEAPNGETRHMKLIPWEDIWTSLRIAQIRGNGDMIEVFYDTLFREAVFDDHGAWSIDLKKATT